MTRILIRILTIKIEISCYSIALFMESRLFFSYKGKLPGYILGFSLVLA